MISAFDRRHRAAAYQEFRRTKAKSDAAAYSNLENIRCGTVDSSLGSFLTLWENLMLTFRTPPSDDHLFSVFTNSCKAHPKSRDDYGPIEAHPL